MILGSLKELVGVSVLGQFLSSVKFKGGNLGNGCGLREIVAFSFVQLISIRIVDVAAKCFLNEAIKESGLHDRKKTVLLTL